MLQADSISHGIATYEKAVDGIPFRANLNIRLDAAETAKE